MRLYIIVWTVPPKAANMKPWPNKLIFWYVTLIVPPIGWCEYELDWIIFAAVHVRKRHLEQFFFLSGTVHGEFFSLYCSGAWYCATIFLQPLSFFMRRKFAWIRASFNGSSLVFKCSFCRLNDLIARHLDCRTSNSWGLSIFWCGAVDNWISSSSRSRAAHSTSRLSRVLGLESIR